MSTEILIRDNLSAGRGGVWAYLSPSRLNCWLTCGLKFKLLYIDGLRTPPTPALFLGRVCHAAMETLYRHRQVGIDLDAEAVTQRMVEGWSQAIAEEGVTFSDAGEEQVLQRQAADLVAAYVRQMPPDEPRPRAVEVAVEAPLIDPGTGQDLGMPLLGIMDLVLDAPSGSVIVDFKTTARSSEPLEILHEVQLTSYAWLFQQVEGQEAAGLQIRSLVKTKVPKVEIHSYGRRTETHFRRLFALIRAYLDDLDARRFLVRPGLHCGMCDFCSTHCRTWAG